VFCSSINNFPQENAISANSGCVRGFVMASGKQKKWQILEGCLWERVGEVNNPSALVGVGACDPVLLEEGVPSLGPQLPLSTPSSQ